jgi:hypothetical protein
LILRGNRRRNGEGKAYASGEQNTFHVVLRRSSWGKYRPQADALRSHWR